LSKVPYAMDGMITVIFDGIHHRTCKQGEGFFIEYMSDYQLSIDNKYRDNKIERTESGSGCWVLSVTDDFLEAVGMFGNVDVGIPVQCTVVIQYPYLKDNIIIVDYIEETDFGIFAKSFMEEDTFSTPKKVSTLDRINFGVQVEAHWPRDLEPNIEN